LPVVVAVVNIVVVVVVNLKLSVNFLSAACQKLIR